MRVTIEHREQASGLTQRHKDTYVDCNVIFSEEERAIIKERDLYQRGFTIRTSTPLPTKTTFWGTNIMRLAGRFMIIGGLVYGIVVEGLAHANTNFGAPILFIGIGLEIWGFLRARKEDKRFQSSEQEITIKQLISNPAFTIHAWDPSTAKALDQELRDNLRDLKNSLQDAATLKEKQTFEL